MVTVAGYVGTVVTPNPTTLTFTTSNWNTDRTVAVAVTDNRFDSDFIDRHSGSTALVENIASQFACPQMGERSEDLDFRIRFGGERIEAADAEPEPENRFGIRVSVHW